MHTLQHTRINHKPLVIMDGCKKCCEINTVSLTCGFLQVLPWNNDTIIEKMDGWKWCRDETNVFQYVHAWNQGVIIIVVSICLLQFLFWQKKIWKNEWLQLLFYNRKRISHRMDGCNWTCGLTQYLWKKGWLQVLAKRDTVPLKILDYCKCYFQKQSPEVFLGIVFWKYAANLQESTHAEVPFGIDALL